LCIADIWNIKDRYDVLKQLNYHNPLNPDAYRWLSWSMNRLLAFTSKYVLVKSAFEPLVEFIAWHRPMPIMRDRFCSEYVDLPKPTSKQWLTLGRLINAVRASADLTPLVMRLLNDFKVAMNKDQDMSDYNDIAGNAFRKLVPALVHIYDLAKWDQDAFINSHTGKPTLVQRSPDFTQQRISPIEGKVIATFIEICLEFQLYKEVYELLNNFQLEVEQGRFTDFDCVILPFLRRLSESSYMNSPFPDPRRQERFRSILTTYIWTTVGRMPIFPLT
jgi:hypothetical protein